MRGGLHRISLLARGVPDRADQCRLEEEEGRSHNVARDIAQDSASTERVVTEEVERDLFSAFPGVGLIMNPVPVTLILFPTFRVNS